jgi:hypothetical protein
MRYFILLSVIFIFVLSNCSNNGMFVGINSTNVELSQANYNIIASNIVGESKAGYILGFSWSYGAAVQTWALGRVDGTGMLYKEALEDLWEKYQAEHGSIEGKKLALANVRYDSESLNLLIYTSVKVFVRADIVEFTE